MDRPCGPLTRGALHKRVKERLLHAWARTADAPFVVREPGGYLAPVKGWDSREARLVADAMAWHHKYLRPAMQGDDPEVEQARHDYRRFVLWLRSQTGQTEASLNAILEAKAILQEQTKYAVKRQFYRKVERCIQRIMLGLIRDGVAVEPVEIVAPQQNRSEMSQGLGHGPAQEADDGRAQGLSS